jgi:hypothetical protein
MNRIEFRTSKRKGESVILFRTKPNYKAGRVSLAERASLDKACREVKFFFQRDLRVSGGTFYSGKHPLRSDNWKVFEEFGGPLNRSAYRSAKNGNLMDLPNE